jgi:hypothetical protein
MGAIVHRPGGISQNYWKGFQPRVGLAWNVRPRIVFRGNFGILSQDLFMTSLGQNFEEYFATAAVQSPVGDPRPAFRLSQGPGPVQFNIAANGSAPFVGTNFSSRNASWIDPNIRPPYIMNWSGGVQWQLTGDVVMETIYQGSAGVGLLNNWDINVVPLNVASDYATLDNIRRNVQNFKPYPQFGSIQLYSNFGHNTYHGGTIRVEHRYAAGLSFNAFYTYSKSLNENEGDGTDTGASGLALVDFDQDGDLDALVTNGDMLDDALVKPYQGIRWLENRGSFPWVAHDLAGLPGVERALAEDLDGDGDLDVVACAFVPAPEGSGEPGPRWPSLVWLEQTERGRFVRHTLERGGSHVSLDAADYDRDGDMDLVVGTFQGEGDVSLEVWENRSARPSAR